jgi:hypothetical protein
LSFSGEIKSINKAEISPLSVFRRLAPQASDGALVALKEFSEGASDNDFPGTSRAAKTAFVVIRGSFVATDGDFRGVPNVLKAPSEDVGDWVSVSTRAREASMEVAGDGPPGEIGSSSISEIKEVELNSRSSAKERGSGKGKGMEAGNSREKNWFMGAILARAGSREILISDAEAKSEAIKYGKRPKRIIIDCSIEEGILSANWEGRGIKARGAFARA